MTKISEKRTAKGVVRREHFLKNLESDDDTDKKKVYAKIIEKNAMFVDEPIYAKELQDKVKNILNKYDVGKLREKYLSHLHYVVMVDSLYLIP